MPERPLGRAKRTAIIGLGASFAYECRRRRYGDAVSGFAAWLIASCESPLLEGT